MEIYKIRLQVVATADNNGSNAAGVSASEITAALTKLNEIYVLAGVEFMFSESTDFMTVNSTLLNRELTVLEPPNVHGDQWDHKPLFDKESHHQARVGFANEFPGKLVLIIHKRVALKQDDETGNWFLKSVGGASSATAAYVNLSPGISAAQLGHEIGHYLQLPHTFDSGVKTVPTAASKIRAYVEAGHPKSEGLHALDGDRGAALDTPADVAGAIWVNAGLDKCDPNKLLIPVTFSDSSSRTYELEPNRSLVMSYFKGCPGPKTLSSQQARRVRDALELRVRQNLISMKSSHDLRIVRGGTGTGGAISQLDIAMVRGGRVVTAVRAADDQLKLIVWDIDSNGTEISRTGEGVAGTVGKIAVCGLGMSMVATAVCDGQGRLKVILWRVEENGDVKRVADETRDGQIDNVAISILNYSMEKNFFATVSRRTDGSLRADVWQVFPDGRLKFKTDKAFLDSVANTGSATPQLTLNSLGGASVVAYHVDRLKRFWTIVWHYEDDTLVRKEKLLNSADADRLSGCGMSRSVSVAAIRDKEQKLKLFAFRSLFDGTDLEARGKASGGSIGEVDLCNLGTEMVVTGVRTAANNLKVILWHVTRTGDVIARLADASAQEDFSHLAICQTGRNQFTTAIRDGEGKLKVIVWRIPAVISINSSSSAPLNDGFNQPFPKSLAPTNGGSPIDEDSCETD